MNIILNINKTHKVKQGLSKERTGTSIQILDFVFQKYCFQFIL